MHYVMHYALACTINCVLLAITHAYKCSWQLKPRYFAGGSEGLSRSKCLLFEGKNHGPKDRAELQEYIGEPLARSAVVISRARLHFQGELRLDTMTRLSLHGRM